MKDIFYTRCDLTNWYPVSGSLHAAKCVSAEYRRVYGDWVVCYIGMHDPETGEIEVIATKKGNQWIDSGED